MKEYYFLTKEYYFRKDLQSKIGRLGETSYFGEGIFVTYGV